MSPSTTTFFIMGMVLLQSAMSMVLPRNLIEKRTNTFIEASAVDAFTPYGTKVPGPGSALFTYLATTQTGLSQLSASIDQDNYATAQNTYTTLSGYLDAILFYVDSNNQGCPSAGTGHQIDAAEAHALIAAIERYISDLATQGGLTTAEQVKYTCDARASFFNSGLREFVFHNQNTGTGT